MPRWEWGGSRVYKFGGGGGGEEEGVDGEVYVMRNFTSDKSYQFHLLFQERIKQSPISSSHFIWVHGQLMNVIPLLSCTPM